MDKPWLLSPEEVDKAGLSTVKITHTYQGTPERDAALCRAQHLKTLEWVNQHMFSLIQDGTTFGMQKWESLLAQAKKDVGDG